MRTQANYPLLGLGLVLVMSLGTGCFSNEPTGIAPAQPARTTVKMDFEHRPLPEIPLPNDVATRYDAASPTLRRINASQVAPTEIEKRTRRLVDELDGWGVLMPISIPFTGPLDLRTIRRAHCNFEPNDTAETFCKFDTDTSDDAVYLINIDPKSKQFGKLHHMDVGHGNYPLVVEDIGGYWANDPRGWTQSVVFEEANEDTNGNGKMDLGEDNDLDGVLDVPNYLPGMTPDRSDLRGRADALMTFYERETNSILLRPMNPLEQRTTYAVVVTRRIKDSSGQPVGSPYPSINHTAQNEALKQLPRVLPPGLKLEDVAFAFSFTTQTIQDSWKVVRDGLYGDGVQGHLAAEYPPEFTELFDLQEGNKPHLLYTEEWVPALNIIVPAFLGGDTASVATQTLVDSHKFIDYHVMGSFESAQLFDRVDENGADLPLDAQSWPNNLDTVPVKARSETVYFWMTVPRKEISARGEGKPAPIALIMHGYGSNRFDGVLFAGFMAQHGIATIAIDCVSHGLGMNEEEMALAKSITGSLGLSKVMDSLLLGRAADLDGDGVVDSGADYWTSYMFHTRDLVRQSVFDHMQLARILRSFDGQKRWAFDTNGDGQPDLAGDFDGDGVVDLGGPDAIMAGVGASLGGIVGTVIGGVEPHMDVVVPIAGGGALSEGALRSQQGGVREAVLLRAMGPLYVGDLSDGTLAMSTIVPDLNDDTRVAIGTLEGASVGDTLIAHNLNNGSSACGVIDADGKVRVGLESNLEDETVLELYAGHAIENRSDDCDLIEDAVLIDSAATFEVDVPFQTTTYAAGSPLVAIAEGMGRKRATPGLRRLIAFAQMILDPGDPAVNIPFAQKNPITYANGETTGTHAMIVTTIGDMNVPASMGGSIARAGGWIDYLNVDQRWGKTANQMLIDTGMYEAVHTISRYSDKDGTPGHLDVENLSQGRDPWGPTYPRLDPPARLFGADTLGGISGALWPFPKPEGQHGFELPGGFIDLGRKNCKRDCEIDDGTADPCGCADKAFFDIGTFLLHAFGRYVASNGTVFDLSQCNSDASCADLVTTPPPSRPISELR